MASYTMLLKTLIEQPTQYEKGLSTKERIEKGRKTLFDFDYPIFDENYRKVLETNFIRNFYMREIGFETEGLFKFYLESWMQLNMPYYNKLFESELIDFDPLENSRYDVTSNKVSDKTENEIRKTTSNVTASGATDTTTNGTSNTTENTDTDSTVTEDNFERTLYSDNPDSRLALTANDGEGVIEYASKINEENENNSTTANENKNSTSNTSMDGTENTNISSEEDRNIDDTANRDINDIEDYVSHRAGKIGVQSYSKLLAEYRETFLRIEKKMYDEMQELFMLVY